MILITLLNSSQRVLCQSRDCPLPLDKTTNPCYTKTMNETNPTVDELNLIEDESITDDIHSDLSGDDYADAMLAELGLNWFLHWGLS